MNGAWGTLGPQAVEPHPRAEGWFIGSGGRGGTGESGKLDAVAVEAVVHSRIQINMAVAAAVVVALVAVVLEALVVATVVPR